MPECRVVFENRLPDWWQATITNIGAAFSYKRADESVIELYKAEKNVSLGPNQTDQLNSNNPAACVGEVLAAVRVHLRDHDEGASKSYPNVPKSCTTSITVTLQPKQNALLAKTLAEIDPKDAIEILISSPK